MRPLEPDQVSLSSTVLVEASAGTGKTYTIETLFVRLLLERSLTVSQILVVTFTNAATAELRHRIRTRVRDVLATTDRALAAAPTDPLRARRELLLQALRDFDEAAIFTIHGFCQRVLQQHAFESGVGFDVELITDQRPLLEEIVHDFWARQVYPAPLYLVRAIRKSGLRPGLRQVQGKSGGDLLGLADRVTARPDMPVLPDRAELEAGGGELGAALEAAVAAFAAEKEALRLSWETSGAQVRTLLHQTTALNRTSYRQDRVTGWLDGIGAYLGAAGDPTDPVPLPSPLVKLTPAVLEKGTKKNQAPPKHGFFVDAERLVLAWQRLQETLGRAERSIELDLVDYARAELPKRKEAAETQSFDDLLHQLDRALAGASRHSLAEAVRGRFRAALIDEFQDTDPVQYRIFRALYPDNTLFLIGDPKQAIYSFRGADVFAYLAAAKDAGAHAYTLAINRRSDPALVRAFNTLFQRIPAPFLVPGIEYVEAQPRPGAADLLAIRGEPAPALEILFVSREGREGKSGTINKGWAERQLPGATAGEIRRFLGSGAMIDGRPVHPGQIAVLVRKNAQARAVQDALRALQIPSVLQSEASVLESEEAGDVLSVLRAIAEPTRASAIKSALATTLLGGDGSAIYALQDDAAGWDVWAERFAGWHEQWVRRGFIQAYRRFLEDAGVAERLLGLTGGERRLTNVHHLGELLHQAATERRLGVAGLITWFGVAASDPTARAAIGADGAQVRLESDAEAVKLVTIHKSKGLEYPVVLCPYAWDGALLRKAEARRLSFHDAGDHDRLKLDLGSAELEAHRVMAEREVMAENLRLLYVALTRAKHRVQLVWGGFSSAETSALGYLLHAPPGLREGAREAAKARIETLGDAGLLSELASIVASSKGAIATRELSFADEAIYVPEHPQVTTRSHRRLRRPIDTSWGRTSFSAMTSGDSGADHAAGPEEGRDRDAAESVPAPEPSPEEATIILEALPGGTAAGDVIHEVLEQIDFSVRDRAALEVEVRGALARHGFEPDTHCAAVSDALEATLDTPLEPGPAGFPLRAITLAHRKSELGFVFPVGPGPGGQVAQPERQVLTPDRLAAVYARHERPPIPGSYPDRLRRLGFGGLRGFLSGAIDLVFEHQGLWYLVDYKSSRLGPRPSDYRQPRLVENMAEHHYFLQYGIYAVALHRYLGRRIPDYDYDRHFGAVYYLYVRGMSPEYGAGHGVFRDRPERRLIEDLDALITDPTPAHAPAPWRLR